MGIYGIGKYESDSERSTTEKRVKAPNSARLGMLNLPEIKGTEASYKDHMYEGINDFKRINLYITDFEGSRGEFWSAGKDVHPNARLYLDQDLLFGFSYRNDIQPGGLESLKNSAVGGFLKSADAILEFGREYNDINKRNADIKDHQSINGGRMISQYEMAPVWKKTDPIKGPPSLKFVFKYGQYGLFNCLEEVIKPILVLASHFAPVIDGKNSHMVLGPWPTSQAVLARMLHSVINDTSGTGKDIMDSLTKTGEATSNAVISGAGALASLIGGLGSNTVKEDSNGNTTTTANKGLTKQNKDDLDALVETATKLEENILIAYDKAVEGAYGGGPAPGKGKALLIKIGNGFEFGPYVVKSVNWDLDFTQTDEYGYPYKGTLTYGELENIKITTTKQVYNHFYPWSGVK